LLTHWGVVVTAPATRFAGGEDVTIDLTTPRTSAGAGLGAAGESDIWTNLERRPFRVSVRLPDGRAFSTEAVLAVLLRPAPDQNPTRLTVKLPATDLEGALRTLAELTPDWQLDETEIAAWETRAAAVTTASHAYSTRVFAAQPAGFVRRELQVEHHIEHDTYIVDALFSWDA
jgi:hypothetical protein